MASSNYKVKENMAILKQKIKDEKTKQEIKYEKTILRSIKNALRASDDKLSDGVGSDTTLSRTGFILNQIKKYNERFPDVNHKIYDKNIKTLQSIFFEVVKPKYDVKIQDALLHKFLDKKAQNAVIPPIEASLFAEQAVMHGNIDYAIKMLDTAEALDVAKTQKLLVTAAEHQYNELSVALLRNNYKISNGRMGAHEVGKALQHHVKNNNVSAFKAILGLMNPICNISTDKDLLAGDLNQYAIVPSKDIKKYKGISADLNLSKDYLLIALAFAAENGYVDIFRAFDESDVKIYTNDVQESFYALMEKVLESKQEKIIKEKILNAIMHSPNITWSKPVLESVTSLLQSHDVYLDTNNMLPAPASKLISLKEHNDNAEYNNGIGVNNKNNPFAALGLSVKKYEKEEENVDNAELNNGIGANNKNNPFAARDFSVKKYEKKEKNVDNDSIISEKHYKKLPTNQEISTTSAKLVYKDHKDLNRLGRFNMKAMMDTVQDIPLLGTAIRFLCGPSASEKQQEDEEAMQESRDYSYIAEQQKIQMPLVQQNCVNFLYGDKKKLQLPSCVNTNIKRTHINCEENGIELGGVSSVVATRMLYPSSK